MNDAVKKSEILDVDELSGKVIVCAFTGFTIVVFLPLNPKGESEMLYSAKASSNMSSGIPCFRELFFQGEF